MQDYNIKSIRQDFKEKGIFYTQKELAEYLKSFLPDDVKEIYDPTCGNGGLLSVFPDDIEKYGQDFFKVSDENEIRRVFTTMYMEILDSLSLEDKTIILDGTQLRFIEDVNLIKGEVIILRPSIETCIQRSVSRKKYQKPNITEDELKAYEERRRHILYKLNPLLNNLIIQINNKVNQIANEQSSGLKH